MSLVNILDAKRAHLFPRFLNAPVEVSLSGTSSRSSQLPLGAYLIKSDETTYIKQGGSSVDADTNDWIIEAGVTYTMRVEYAGTDDYLAGILASGTGTLQILQIV